MRVEICQPNLSLGSLTSLERELGVPNSMEGVASRSKRGRFRRAGSADPGDHRRQQRCFD